MAVQIETTQNVVIEQEQAGLGLRTIAYIIDIAIEAIWCIAVIIFLVSINKNINESIMIGLWFLFYLPIAFYDIAFEVFNKGQSPGKMIMSLRVVKLDGSKPSWGSFLIRWLFRPVDFAMTNYILAIVMILSTKNGQRLGDYLAGTTVVNLKADKQDQELKLSELDIPQNYTVTFPDVLERLTDNDVRTILTVLDELEYNEITISNIADRVKVMTGYTNFQGNNTMFLRTLVNDYKYLSIL